MNHSPRVVIGLPLYNGGPYVDEALESLLAQTYRDVAFVCVDDGSNDGTDAVVRRYMRHDQRLSYERNQERVGMIRNWRRVFEAAREQHGEFEYFAWGSDHDVWHRCWIERMVAALDTYPEAVLAHPLALGITDGDVVVREPFEFETDGILERGRRLRIAAGGMAAGYMIYGLMRAPYLPRCGIFREVLLPDRLLLSELACFGTFVQVPEILWYRRFRPGVIASIDRQRASFFPEGAPVHSYMPWWLQHSWALGTSLVIRGAGRPEIPRAEAARLAVRFLSVSLFFDLKRRAARRVHRYRKHRTAGERRVQAILRASSRAAAPAAGRPWGRARGGDQ